MDNDRFDNLTRAFARPASRRSILQAFAGSLLGSAAGTAMLSPAAAQGCAHPGQSCAADGDCCGTLTCVTGACAPPGQSGNTGPGTGNGNGGGNAGCASGLSRCGGACLDLTSDIGNCGGCGTVCPAATDPCQVAVCTNGSCGVGPGNDGATCDDGNPCTQTDTCQGGTCVGGNPVPCPPADACHGPGTCDPSTGQCGPTPLLPGTCFINGTCYQAGEGDPTDQCQVCDPSQSLTAFGFRPDGTACDDGNPCTQTDTCQHGVCLGGNYVVCTAPDACHAAGDCNAETGTCSHPALPDGTSCGPCQTCTGGVCGGGCDATQCLTCGTDGTTCKTAADGADCGNGQHCCGGICCLGGAVCAGEQCCPSDLVCGTAPNQTCCSGLNQTCLNGACCFTDAVCGGLGVASFCCGAGQRCDSSGTSCCSNNAEVCAHSSDCCSGFCVSGNCQPNCGDLGAGCTGDADCCNGQCVDGVCCSTASCGTCQACNVSGSAGTCTTVENGNACGTDQICCSGSCCPAVANATATCNSSGTCTYTCDATAAACGSECCTSDQYCVNSTSCCTPKTCAEQGYVCNDHSGQTDGCGHPIDCGDPCAVGAVCYAGPSGGSYCGETGPGKGG